ncbi:hypothetical protein BpHYR1_018657 [Brachionus plicatilis]|uniref:Uncharacterized protein n=1 Tax=Brachionus plicatilis TaxID=10195 RepID=A0A3M7PLH2_BRAPC|nr:hypothetical protein BpHYR1_018657 [Brachionus plicatilis]
MKYPDTDSTNTTRSEDNEPSSEETYEVAPRFFKDFICLKIFYYLIFFFLIRLLKGESAISKYN